MSVLKDANQVNKWCSDATHKKIPKIVDNISEADKMVLINAIYFKGTWEQPFDKNDTHKDTFLNFNNQPKQVDFMNSTKKFDYFEDQDIQSISLNYDKDKFHIIFLGQMGPKIFYEILFSKKIYLAIHIIHNFV